MTDWRNMERRVLFGLVAAISALFLWMIQDLLIPVFWATVFAILFHPLHIRLLGAFRGRENLTALVGTIIVAIVALVPSFLLVAALTQQALGLYDRVSTGDVRFGAVVEAVEEYLPPLSDLLQRYGIDVQEMQGVAQDAAASAAQYLAGQALSLGQNALTVTLFFALTLYFLFFFFRDGQRIVEALIRALPLGDERERRMFAKIAQVSRATVKGTIVVAAVQGFLGGLLFAALGIQAAVFWGVIMGALSLLPAVGAPIVWLPAAVILFATGEIWRGLAMVGGGALVVSLVDNILRPILVGRDTRMPDYLVLIATLGGLTLFGLAGFVAGPIIGALFLVAWEMLGDEFAADSAADVQVEMSLFPASEAEPGTAGEAISESDDAPPSKS